MLYPGETIFLLIKYTILFITHLAKPLDRYHRELWKKVIVNIILLFLWDNSRLVCLILCLKTKQGNFPKAPQPISGGLRVKTKTQGVELNPGLLGLERLRLETHREKVLQSSLKTFSPKVSEAFVLKKINVCTITCLFTGEFQKLDSLLII